MRIVRWFFHILVLSISGCTNYSCESAKQGYAEIRSFAKKMHREKHWDLMLIGGIYDEPYLKKMSVGFECEDIVDVLEARRLLIVGVEAFLKDINTNKQLRPYLPEFPLTYRNIFFGIGFKIVPSPNINYAFLFDGEDINYYGLNPLTGKSEQILQESFEEAFQIIAMERVEGISPEQSIVTINSRVNSITDSISDQELTNSILKVSCK